MKKRNEYPVIITPRGEVAWAQLNEPDYEYKKETGEFHVRIRPDTDDPQYAVMVEKAEAVRDEFYDETVEKLTREKKGALLKKLHKRDVVQEEIDRESGDPTGAMIMRAGEAYHITIKNGPKAGKEFFKVPDFFDARGARLKNPPKIGSGSILKLGVRLMPYLANDDGEVGISYKLEGVQIIKLVSGGQRSASDYGFGEEPDGDSIEDGEDTGGFSDEGNGFEGGSEGGPRDF
jgi:hypothetical protein